MVLLLWMFPLKDVNPWTFLMGDSNSNISWKEDTFFSVLEHIRGLCHIQMRMMQPWLFIATCRQIQHNQPKQDKNTYQFVLL